MRSLFEEVGLRLIIEKETEMVFVSKNVIVKYIRPIEETENRHSIQLEYNKVFLSWDTAWYHRTYSEEELEKNAEQLKQEIRLIEANCDKAIYLDHLMKVEGFEDWWRTDVEYIESLLSGKARD